MSDLSPQHMKQLKAKLARLNTTASEFDGPWANLGSTTGGAMLERMLQEVDDTVLAARLTLRRGEDTLVFDSAGRRLVRVHSTNVQAAEGAPLNDHTLAPEDAEALQALATAAKAFADLEGAVTVQAERLDDNSNEASVGVSTLQLEESWGLKVELPEGDTPLQMLRSGLGDHVAAYMLILDGVVDRFKGKKKLISEIEDLLENRLMEFDEQRIARGYRPSDPSLTVLQNAGPDQETLLVAIRGQEILIAFGDSDLLATGHKVWRLIS